MITKVVEAPRADRRRAATAPAPPARAAFTRGLGHATAGRHDDAIAAYREAIEADPSYAEAHNNLANVHRERNEIDQAVAAYEAAIAARPDYALAHFNLGCVFHERGEAAKARAAYEAAIAARPDWAEPLYNRATLLGDAGAHEAAADGFRRTVTLDPRHTGAWNNLGLAMRRLGRHDEALAAHARAIAADPGNVRARFNAGIAHLTRGEFEAGWPLYESRLEIGSVVRKAGLRAVGARWQGEPLGGRTLLVEAEQGLGDTIQFVRYLPLVRARAEARGGGTIVLACDPGLLRLLKDHPGIDRLIEKPSPAGHSQSDHDLHVSLLSLPAILETTLATIPDQVPYLHADPTLIEAWRARLRGTVLKVGLVWAGRPQHENDRNRSIQLNDLASFGRVAGVRYFSLQKGEAAAQGKKPPAGMLLTNLGADLHDMADTAAAIANLDLVITVDTAVAHLAGAMGKPIWTLIPHVPDWRWMRERADSPWYPTMRLYRQERPRAWGPAIARIAEALAVEAKEKAARHPGEPEGGAGLVKDSI